MFLIAQTTTTARRQSNVGNCDSQCEIQAQVERIVANGAPFESVYRLNIESEDIAIRFELATNARIIKNTVERGDIRSLTIEDRGDMSGDQTQNAQRRDDDGQHHAEEQYDKDCHELDDGGTDENVMADDEGNDETVRCDFVIIGCSTDNPQLQEPRTNTACHPSGRASVC